LVDELQSSVLVENYVVRCTSLSVAPVAALRLVWTVQWFPVQWLVGVELSDTAVRGVSTEAECMSQR
jgi:hypothetical protein